MLVSTHIPPPPTTIIRPHSLTKSCSDCQSSRYCSRCSGLAQTILLLCPASDFFFSFSFPGKKSREVRARIRYTRPGYPPRSSVPTTVSRYIALLANNGASRHAARLGLCRLPNTTKPMHPPRPLSSLENC